MIFEEIKSGRSQLRQFGIALGVVLGIWGGLLLMREKSYYYYFLIFSFTFLLLGLTLPQLLKPIQRTWMSLAIIIGWVVTRLILSALFYLVVTPIGILARIAGKSFLDTKFDRTRESYWIPRSPAEFDKESYERQF
jgi:hypothetical protein